MTRQRHGREGDRVSDACDQPASHRDPAAETSTTQCLSIGVCAPVSALSLSSCALGVLVPTGAYSSPMGGTGAQTKWGLVWAQPTAMVGDAQHWLRTALLRAPSDLTGPLNE